MTKGVTIIGRGGEGRGVWLDLRVLLRLGSCQGRDGERDPGTSSLICTSASCFLLVLLLHAQAEWVDLNPSEMEQQMLQEA